MLHRPTFLNSLQLPPSNPHFPVSSSSPVLDTILNHEARALLHAILGLTAPHLSPTSLATRAYFPVGASFSDIVHPEHDFTPQGASYRNLSGAFHFQASGIASPTSPMGRFQMWHRRKALQSMAIEFDAGQKLLQAVQGALVPRCPANLSTSGSHPDRRIQRLVDRSLDGSWRLYSYGHTSADQRVVKSAGRFFTSTQARLDTAGADSPRTSLPRSHMVDGLPG